MLFDIVLANDVVYKTEFTLTIVHLFLNHAIDRLYCLSKFYKLVK